MISHIGQFISQWVIISCIGQIISQLVMISHIGQFISQWVIISCIGQFISQLVMISHIGQFISQWVIISCIGQFISQYVMISRIGQIISQWVIISCIGQIISQLVMISHIGQFRAGCTRHIIRFPGVFVDRFQQVLYCKLHKSSAMKNVVLCRFNHDSLAGELCRRKGSSTHRVSHWLVTLVLPVQVETSSETVL